jgi:putative transposase
MPYTTNPKMPRLRMEAIKLIKNKGWSIRKVARYTGYSASTISRWLKKAPVDGRKTIPTLSSRPKTSPGRIDRDKVKRIVEIRRDTKDRCSEVVCEVLRQEGVDVSVSTVKRTLKRNLLLREKSPWKKYHLSGERPIPLKPGDLVQMDTIHIMKNKRKRIYVYTLIDVYSRNAYAFASNKISAGRTIDFFRKAQRKLGFDFRCIQTDHGPEFSKHFSRSISIRHRHSRVRKPNDNSHIERFNRTLREELLNSLDRNILEINRHLIKYLKYYNQERLHLGINLKTPLQVLQRC